MKTFTFAHTFEADYEIEAETYEEAEKIAFSHFGKCKVVNEKSGKDAPEFVEMEPWEIS